MSVLIFTVPGLPAPKKRPRVAFKDRQGRTLKKPHTYTPGRTGAYEKRIAWAAIAALAGDDLLQAEIPLRSWVELEVTAYVVNPGQGDGDNFLKTAADALQGTVYLNDRQIVDWIVHVRPVGTCGVVAPCLIVRVSTSPLALAFPEPKKKKRARRAKAVSRGA